MNPFGAFIEAAWNEHADRPQAVADRLVASIALARSPEETIAFARLAVHVYGEHLGQWQRGVDLLDALRGAPATVASEPTRQAIARGIATLRCAGGEVSALDALPAEDQAAALAAASSALAGRDDFDAAIAAFGEALRRLPAGLADTSPAVRALAVGGNNLAAALEGKADRDATQSAAMVEAARAGLQYWKRAGTWLEEAWAHYRLASGLLQVRDTAAALQSAQACLEVCLQREAPAFEQFFACAILARAQRAAGDSVAFVGTRERARAHYRLVPEDERDGCKDALAMLDE